VSYSKGERVGDYEIVDVLGAGGMGRVYKVRNTISDRVEAMKVLLPNLESDPDLADRFMREIKVQASLQHPNIAALHTALRVNNQLLMLIEFVEGVSLEAELRKGPIPVAKAVDYIRQVLLALGYAHAHGVVHRDIKPANIMLMPDGTVKLMDFGIARLSADRRLTQTGRTVGSLYYMSPEQIQGALDLDARSDIYSLGVSLYEMVTARRPFQGDSDYSIMAAHLSARPVPPIELDASLPAALNDVILMAIAKEPGQRFQTADAFRKAVESVLPAAAAAPAVAAVAAPPSPSAPPPARGSRRGLYMAVGSAVTIAVLAIAALQAPRFFSSGRAAGPVQVPAPSTVTDPHPQQAPSTNTPPDVPPAKPAEPAASLIAPVSAPAHSQPRESVQRIPDSKPAAAVERPDTSVASAPNTPAANQSAVPGAVSAQTPQAPVTPPNTEDLRASRELLMLLGTRANSVKASLTSLKQQQARMGTNLRGDILTAEQRMEFYLDEAEAAVRAGEAGKAKISLQSAERALEVVEKFLGR
jgi:serine/threonine-protein kinase